MSDGDTMKLLRKIIDISFISFFLLTVMFIGLYIYAEITPKVDLKLANNIVIYDRNNNVIFNGNGGKEWVSLKDISPYLINATLSTEDKRFYQHFGFDIRRIIKSMWINLISGKIVQGASTITQQYARNLFMDFSKTWGRKLQEAWLTFELEVHYSKNQILEGYLNTINYGNGILGIENASEYYFDKHASELTLAEASMLAGIPKSPNNYSPLNDELEAKKRQNLILTNMVKNNKITKREKEDAFDTKLVYYGKKDKLNLATLMYYQDAVMKELKSIGYINSSLIEKSGIKIYTGLDLNAQTILENNFTNYMKDDPELQVASVMIQPKTGEILALIGGRSYIKSEFNRATSSKRQVGSTMKPFLYYAALESGFTASTTFLSEPTVFTFSDSDTYAPKNYAEIYPKKDITMEMAISYSDNIYAVKTHLFLGEDALVDIAKRVGIKEKLEPNPSLPLGTTELNIIDFLGGYATLANEGDKVTPHLITKIVDSNNHVLYQYKVVDENVLNRSTTYVLNELLTATYDLNLIDYNYPTCSGIAPKLTKKYALKTGTTDTDVWTIGYNSDVLLGIWNGYDNNKDVGLEVSKMSKNMWADSMEEYLKDKSNDWYKMPDNVIGVLVNPIDGKLATEKSPKKKILYYIKGTEPTESD